MDGVPGMKSLVEVVGRFRGTRLLVVGDLMLDRFVWGDVERISPEAPVPVLRVTSEDSRLGGAANVIHNIRALGGLVTACGVIGRDEAGKRIVKDLRRLGVSTAGVFRDGRFQTIQKTRIIARPRHQQIVRLDRENPVGLEGTALNKIRQFVHQQLPRYDGIVLSDYGKGVIHDNLLDLIAEALGKDRRVCVVDPKKENYKRYRLPTLVTPNKDEASEASGILIRDGNSLLAAGERLLKLWQAKAVLITRGPEGMSLFRPRQAVKHFPTEAREIFEVTGAGDTVVAVCALALASGASYEDAAVTANLAAGLVGGEVGTVAVPLQRLKRTIKEQP
ncbi:MAG: D-glycero-beta-D-manno-heptose-7-phosphate kinase [Candidatus Binatia bacterium]